MRVSKITHEFRYTSDMVCEDCGSSEWHVNITYNNRNGGIFYGEINSGGWETGEDTWCSNCGGWRDLALPKE